MGVNNLVLPGASMPHVLWELQGWQGKAAAPAEGEHAEGGHGAAHSPFASIEPGKLSSHEYDKLVGD
ncbi:MAG: cytochrome c1, partial [Panacagrimonas sp.]